MRKLLLAVIMVLATSGSAFPFGLQVADTAEEKDQGGVEFLAGVAVGRVTTPGARLTYNLTDGSRVFLEGGYASWKHDKAMYIAGGFLFLLSEQFDLPIPLAVRGSYSYGFFEEGFTFWDFNFMAVTTFDFEPFMLYCGGGLNYNKTEWTRFLRGDRRGGFDYTSWDAAAAAGVFYQLESYDSISLYGEVTYIGDFYGGGGIRFAF